MAIINVITRHNIEGAQRIEAEYYQPHYLAIDNKLKTLTNNRFYNLTYFVKKGIFDLPPTYYTNIGIPLIRTTEIKSEIADISECARIPEAIHIKHINNELNSGDIVFTNSPYAKIYLCLII